jgi:EamA domain-containing membrane protein RarD
MSGPRLLSFALIWLAVAIYAADAAMRRNPKSGI